jgi:hypothetical protein
LAQPFFLVTGFEQQRREDRGKAQKRPPAVECNRAAEEGEENPRINRVPDITRGSGANQRMVFFDLDPGASIPAETDPRRDGDSQAERGEGDAQPSADGGGGGKGGARIAGVAPGTAVTTVPRRASALCRHWPLTGSHHCVAFAPRAAIAQWTSRPTYIAKSKRRMPILHPVGLSRGAASI